ncbi:hypothetical protein B0T24DRAFT_420882 [Lasiosphaeria ovina]|uniref:Uncharacterized protein n=1 Tax=Lasiosphaeria ovina TaxID=92902 RepID=A0AAE0JVW4_9PEZI|nr:hypothetical protein B0T24DRAFT_420882 [Lasiosphaeria ovina]
MENPDARTISPSLSTSAQSSATLSLEPSPPASTKSSATLSLEPEQQQQQGHDQQTQHHHVYQQDYDGQMLLQPPLLLPSQPSPYPSSSQYHPFSRNDQQSQSQPPARPFQSRSKPPAESSFSAGPKVMQALDMARESREAECHPQISALLDGALAEVMARLRAAPDSYVMRCDEFSF